MLSSIMPDPHAWTLQKTCEGSTSDTSLDCSLPQPTTVIPGISTSASNWNKRVLLFCRCTGGASWGRRVT